MAQWIGGSIQNLPDSIARSEKAGHFYCQLVSYEPDLFRTKIFYSSNFHYIYKNLRPGTVPDSYSGLADQDLLILLKQDNKQSFEELYKRYNTRIYGNLKKLVKSAELAEEMLQEVFVKVWVKRTDIDIEKSFRSYLFRIAENLVYDFFRKSARDKKLEEHLIYVATAGYSHMEESLYSNEDLAILSKAIDQLPPRRKHIFTLCKLEGKSYEEVSKELGISTSTINDHIVKASRSVKDHFSVTAAFAALYILSALH